jgi:hypothetical protein
VLIAVVVAALAVALGPARGWLAQRLGSTPPRESGAPGATGDEGGATGSEGDRGDAAAEAAMDVVAATFVPAGPEVTLVFEPGIEGRRLILEPSADSTVVLRATGPEVAMAVEADQVEIQDASRTAREIRVGVPAGVERVRVRVPGASTLVVVVDVEGGEHVVEVPRGGE